MKIKTESCGWYTCVSEQGFGSPWTPSDKHVTDSRDGEGEKGTDHILKLAVGESAAAWARQSGGAQEQVSTVSI